MNIDENQLHIWKVNTASDAEDIFRARDVLSEDEHKRADKYKFHSYREHFVRRRYLLRNILSKYCHCRPEEIKFRYNVFGKPFIDMPGFDSMFFNMSFSADLLLICIASGLQPGIDIEKKRNILGFENIVSDNFSRDEFLSFYESEDKETYFYKIWTRKEALVKAIGKGLHLPLSSFSVGEGTIVRFETSALEVAGNIEGWNVIDIEIGEGYLAALAIKTKMLSLRYFYL